MKKTSANHIADKKLNSRNCKIFLQLDIKKEISKLKNGQESEKLFLQKTTNGQ